MKIKKSLIFLAIILASICLFSFSNRVNAVTISNDGKYTLILECSNETDANIDGESNKVIKFNVAEGETTVKLSELTKGIVPFNGRTEFAYWGSFIGEKANEEIAITDFCWSGELTEGEYTNGLTIANVIIPNIAIANNTAYTITLSPVFGFVFVIVLSFLTSLFGKLLFSWFSSFFVFSLSSIFVPCCFSFIVNFVIASPLSEKATFNVCSPTDNVFKYSSFKVITVLPDFES